MNRFFVVAVALALAVAPLAAQDSLTEWAEQNPPPGGSGSPTDGQVLGEGGSLTFYTSRTDFDTAHPGLPIEDFEEGNVSPGGVVGCPSPLDENNNDACFSPGDILPGITITESTAPLPDGLALIGAGFAGNPSKIVVANFFIENFQLQFSPIVGAAGMDLGCYFATDTVDVTISGPGGVLGTAQALCTNGTAFFGVDTSDPGGISEIIIDSPTDQAEGADNIAFGDVPVPVELQSFDID
jgi:hypothetical protein